VIPRAELARLACHIEIDRLDAPVGKQDQYIAAVGGLCGFEFRPDDTVQILPIEMPDEARNRFDENLLLFYTGVRRSAADELQAQNESLGPLSENLDLIRKNGRRSFDALTAGDLTSFGGLMTEQWKLKLQRSPSAIHKEVDQWIHRGLDAGALGGKLVGAGGGGFLLFLAEEKAELRSAMADLALEEVRISLDYEGTTTIVSR
jgi:D-glycero-alpha-D-manno-heptose-7-phosphate kinase